MSQLHDRIEDLVADVPTYVVPDARAAWAAGARRRTQRRVGVVAVVVAVLALAVAATFLPRTLDPVPADTENPGVGGYPARVVEPWISRDLPAAPGPMAVVYERPGSWWVADAEGHTWRVPQEGDASVYAPALSADGRLLGYLADDATYVVRDLASGDQTVFDSVRGGSAGEQSEERSDLAPHLPGFWSPDGTRLVLSVAMYEPRTDDDTVVLDVDGSVMSLRALGSPVGWVDADTFAVVVNGSAYDGKTPAELRLVGVDGTVERKVRLEVGRDRAAFFGPYSIDPAADRLAALDDDGGISVFSMLDGSRISETPGDAHTGCVPSWQGSEPVVFPATLGRSLVTASGETVVEFDERIGATCGTAASQALAGPRHVGLAQRWLGDGWLSWHVREVALGAIAVALAGVVLLFLRRRRKSLAPTS